MRSYTTARFSEELALRDCEFRYLLPPGYMDGEVQDCADPRDDLRRDGYGAVNRLAQVYTIATAACDYGVFEFASCSRSRHRDLRCQHSGGTRHDHEQEETASQCFR